MYPVVVNFYGGEKSKTGTRRFYCPSCRKSYSSYQKKSGKAKSILFWFEKYVLEGITYHSLCKWSGYTTQSLLFKFHHLLNQDPPPIQLSQLPTDEAYLLIDGLWFGKKFCLVIYRQSKLKLLLHASFMFKEWSSLIAKDLLCLKKKGYRFTGIISDGGTGIRNAVFRTFAISLIRFVLPICTAALLTPLANTLKTKESSSLRNWLTISGLLNLRRL